MVGASALGTSIVGVSIVDVLPGLKLPVLIYSDLISAEELKVYVLDYQVLSTLESQVQVDRTILSQIAADNGLDIQVDGQESRLVWRHRLGRRPGSPRRWWGSSPRPLPPRVARLP